jgi:hypothetical protein
MTVPNRPDGPQKESSIISTPSKAGPEVTPENGEQTQNSRKKLGQRCGSPSALWGIEVLALPFGSADLLGYWGSRLVFPTVRVGAHPLKPKFDTCRNLDSQDLTRLETWLS